MIYVGQTKLTIELETGMSLANVSVASIAYKKPNKTEGLWTGTFAGTKVFYDVETGDLSEKGDWVIWSHIIFDDGKIAIGDPVIMTVKKQGEF